MNETEKLIEEAKKQIAELKDEIASGQAVLSSLVEQLNDLENDADDDQ